jgi:hypothetical protein
MGSSEDLEQVLNGTNEIDSILSEVENTNDVAFSSVNSSTYSSDQLIEMYDEVKTFLVEEYSLTPDLVFEPANGLDVSSAETFNEAEVLYVNQGAEKVEKLEQELECIVRQKDPTQISLDVVPGLSIFKDTTFDESAVLEDNDAEYVVANNHTGSAKNIDGLPRYSLIAKVSEQDQSVDQIGGEHALGEEYLDDNLYIFERN